MAKSLFRIENVSVSVGQSAVLEHIDLVIEQGAACWLLGPNGSGKSSLALTIMGHPRYQITSGCIQFMGNDLLTMPPDERARRGLFLSMQQPISLPGITIYTLLKEACRARQGTQFSLAHFDCAVTNVARELAIELPLLQRSLQDLSGGQKKKIEVLQLLVLQPTLVILDELEAGLDVDAILLVGKALENYRATHKMASFLIISHDQRLADYLPPDQVLVIKKGRLVETGDVAILARVKQKGFDAGR